MVEGIGLGSKLDVVLFISIDEQNDEQHDPLFGEMRDVNGFGLMQRKFFIDILKTSQIQSKKEKLLVELLLMFLIMRPLN